jgi:hypothetical protein
MHGKNIYEGKKELCNANTLWLTGYIGKEKQNIKEKANLARNRKSYVSVKNDEWF